MIETNYGKLVGRLLGVWFILALLASALRVFENSPGRPPLALGLAVALPIVLFSVWYATSAGFREFVLSLNARTLTIAHAWRIGGFTFLVLYAHGILPGLFALPAGWGDIAIGATAPLVAAKLATAEHRKSFILWHGLGMFDLVLAVSLGTLAGFINPTGVSTSPMSVLPLSLIPTFAVPLLLILHLISIAQARRWPERAYSPGAGSVTSSEARG